MRDRSGSWFSAQFGLPHRMVMVRFNPEHSQFADTRHNLEILSGLGLPVPCVLASGLTHADSSLAYLILIAIPGRDLRHVLPSMTEWQMTHLPPNLPSRPHMVVFHNCTKVLVKDVHLQNSPSFHLVPARCNDVIITGITISAPPNAENTDGMDPSGRHFRISNCTFNEGDDCIAIKHSAKDDAAIP